MGRKMSNTYSQQSIKPGKLSWCFSIDFKKLKEASSKSSNEVEINMEPTIIIEPEKLNVERT